MRRRLGWRVARTLPLLAVMTGIFVLSHQTGDDLQLPLLPGLDKLGHASIYALLAASAFFAIAAPFRATRPAGRVAAAVLLFCLLYGLSDEYHQSFVAGRSASGWDLVADGVGAAVVAVLWLRRAMPGWLAALLGR